MSYRASLMQNHLLVKFLSLMVVFFEIRDFTSTLFLELVACVLSVCLSAHRHVARVCCTGCCDGAEFLISAGIKVGRGDLQMVEKGVALSGEVNCEACVPLQHLW